MAFRLGNGLPSTLTPERIEEVLALTKSQERILKKALDTRSSVAWTTTDPDSDLYKRIRSLIATVEGRQAYEDARSDFEDSKAKRLGRADLPRCLIANCLKQSPSLSRAKGHDLSVAQDPVHRLVEANAWASVAETVWAESLICGDAEHLLDAIATYPDIRPYLQDVHAGLVDEEDDEIRLVPEQGGESRELVDRLRRVAENLDADRLNERELLGLSFDAWRLAEIARNHKLRERGLSKLRAQLETWEEQHPEGIAEVEAVANALAVLKTHIEHGNVKQDTLAAAFDLAEGLISVEVRCKEAQQKQYQATLNGDFTTARSLLDALESIQAERDKSSADIRDFLEELRSDPATPETPDVEKRAVPPKPSAEGAQPNLERPRQAGGQLTSGIDIKTTEVPEPADHKGPTLDGEAEFGESDAPESTTQADSCRSDAESVEAAAPHGDDTKFLQRIGDDIATAIERGRLGLAYHLARSVPRALPSADTVKLVACNYVNDERTPLGAELPNVAAALLSEVEQSPNRETDLRSCRENEILTTCAALAPALVAPGGPVSQLLSLMEPRLGDMPFLRKLARTAADVSMKGVHLPITLLREDDTLDKWRDRLSALRVETRTWVRSESRSKIKFHAATRVWRRMLETWENGGRSSLGKMLALLDAEADDIAADRVSKISEYWRTNREKEIDRIDRENRSRASTSKIEGSARMALRIKVDQALTFSDRWLSALRERPDKRPPFHTELVGELRVAVNNNAGQALAEINGTEASLMRIAGDLLRRYAALFKGAKAKPEICAVGLNEMLNGDLFADPQILIDDANQPTDSLVDSEILLNLAKEDAPDFGRAAIERAQRGDFPGAKAAIDFAERSGRIDEQNADVSRTKIEGERSRAQQRLKSEISETSDRLDAAYATGALTLETYERLRDEIPILASPEDSAFARFGAVLERIDAEIGDAQAGRRDALRQSLDTLVGVSYAEKKRVALAIDDGLFQVAEDFMERIERGEELPAPKTTTDRPFDRFFPHFVADYSQFCNVADNAIDSFQQVIEGKTSADFIDVSGLSKDARHDGVDILTAWVALRDNQTSVVALRTLVEALGFYDPKVKGSNDKAHGGEKIFMLQSAPISDRRIVRLPDFGSRASGSYRLFAVRGRVTEEAIIREAVKPNAAGNAPGIALFLGILDVDSRRALARAFSSGEYHPTIVLDEALIAFLAAWPCDRLSAFFDCASAFAFSQPFDPDAAEVPPEMFFGRAHAREAILAMSGDTTHFVYGGRRLGKTALLSDIAREYRTGRQADPKELVLSLNLKGSGIGENRLTKELWSLFAERLTEHRILKPQTVRHETIEKGVKLWLKERPGRRILILVDEADAFLNAERLPEQGYRVLDQIKRLMEQTDRRFKIVFAGLHNVQRAARDPNTPFAHLGEAIRIGPMLPKTDNDEIQNLIRSPLEALGYRFTSSDSLIRIAAETNYYPALAQQFCKELLKTLREESYSLADAGPPYPIDPEVVDRVFNARETRDRICNLFSWTIQLDSPIRVSDLSHRAKEFRQQRCAASASSDHGNPERRTE